ncbi:MAG: helix-turn-helix transcriptional regulator [Candidatus Scalindua sp.]
MNCDHETGKYFLFRIIRGLSKSELARRLGISRQYVTDLLNGKKPITLKSARKIAHALEVPVSGIIGM